MHDKKTTSNLVTLWKKTSWGAIVSCVMMIGPLLLCEWATGVKLGVRFFVHTVNASFLYRDAKVMKSRAPQIIFWEECGRITYVKVLQHSVVIMAQWCWLIKDVTYQDGKKKFEKQTTKFCQSQERYLNLSTKKQDIVLQEVSKPKNYLLLVLIGLVCAQQTRFGSVGGDPFLLCGI